MCVLKSACFERAYAHSLQACRAKASGSNRSFSLTHRIFQHHSCFDSVSSVDNFSHELDFRGHKHGIHDNPLCTSKLVAILGSTPEGIPLTNKLVINFIFESLKICLKECDVHVCMYTHNQKHIHGPNRQLRFGL